MWSQMINYNTLLNYNHQVTIICSKELLGMRILNFVNFDNLVHIKLYNLLISNKIQKPNKNKVKAQKKTRPALFPGRILSCKQVCLHHIAHHTTDTDHLRRHDQSNHRFTSIATTLNWCGNAGRSPTSPIVCSTLGRQYQHLALCCRSIKRLLAGV